MIRLCISYTCHIQGQLVSGYKPELDALLKRIIENHGGTETGTGYCIPLKQRDLNYEFATEPIEAELFFITMLVDFLVPLCLATSEGVEITRFNYRKVEGKESNDRNI